MKHMNHKEPYSDDYLKEILTSVKTIAMVGASPDKTKFSYGVLRVCLLYTSPSPRDATLSRMPSSA